MTINQSLFHQQAIESMKKIWRFYLTSHSADELDYILNHLSDDFVVIGTGKHEIFSGMETISQAIASDQQEIGNSQFEIMDEWYEVQALSENLCFVYGGFCAREIHHEAAHVITDMDTRFTAVYRYENGNIILCNLHHSVPNMDQAMGEFYPKTITQKANAAIQRSLFLEQQLKLDSLTGLYNRTATENYINEVLSDSKNHCSFLMIDIDDFKRINDTYGHLQGDLFLRSFADLLKNTFTQGELISRLGGDEFSVFIQNSTSQSEIEELTHQFLHALKEIAEIPFSVTIGIAFSNSSITRFQVLYKNADNALYHSKKSKKGSYCFYND